MSMTITCSPTYFTVEVVDKARWQEVGDVRLVSEYDHKDVQVKAANLGEACRMANEAFLDQGYVVPDYIYYHHQFEVA